MSSVSTTRSTAISDSGATSATCSVSARQKFFTSLNHVASRHDGSITAPHVAVLLPWLLAIEVNNGSRLPIQNRTAQCLAGASPEIHLGGSDSHAHRGIGLTWTEVPGARTRDRCPCAACSEGNVRVGGRMRKFCTMGSERVSLCPETSCWSGRGSGPSAQLALDTRCCSAACSACRWSRLALANLCISSTKNGSTRTCC